MPKYLILQRHLPTTPETQADKPTPAQMKEMFAQFGAWQAKYKTNLVDMGGKLGEGCLVTGAPQAEAPVSLVHTLVGGYMIVAADSVDEATAVACACPGLVGPGSGVEVIAIHTP